MLYPRIKENMTNKNKLTPIIATVALVLLAYVFLVISVISNANRQVEQSLAVDRMVRYEQTRYKQ